MDQANKVFGLCVISIILRNALANEVQAIEQSKMISDDVTQMHIKETTTTTTTAQMKGASHLNETGAAIRNETVFNRRYCYQDRQPLPHFKETCCAFEVNRFRLAWYTGGYYLTSLLERLQRWGCKEFQKECEKGSFNFTDFNHIVYQRFCNPSKLNDTCYEKVKNVVRKYGFPDNTTNWKQIVADINPDVMTLDDLIDPCVTIALFDRPSGGVGRFHEIVEPYFPFCGLQWHGYDIDTAMKRGVSVWTNLSSGCHQNVMRLEKCQTAFDKALVCRGTVIFFMAFMVLLGIFTTVANLTILLVFGKNKKIRNSQAIFQMSLAIADLLVGVMVWPNMVYMQVVIFTYPRKMGAIITQERLTSGNRTAYFPNFGKDNLERRWPSTNSSWLFSHEYIMYIGFFTLLSVLVSVLTLMAATFDRLFAIVFPLRYRRRNPKRFAAVFCLSVWILCLALCALPVIVNEFEYDNLSSIFISAGGEYGTILQLAALIVPLVVTCFLSTITFEISRRHGIRTKSLFSTARVQAAKTERRLAKTLCLMVSVFSVSVIPAIVCIVIGYFFMRNAFRNPESLDLQLATAYASAEYIAIIVLTANSLWNCFIYSIRNPGFRKSAKLVFSKSISLRENSAGTQRNFTTFTYMSKKKLPSK